MRSITQLFKALLAPLQARLLERHLCVACTRDLDREKHREPLTTKSDLVICECGRAYVFDRERRRYRRAIPAEVRSIPGY
jgi:hypothetical protein